jgi:hypothetical protein
MTNVALIEFFRSCLTGSSWQAFLVCFAALCLLAVAFVHRFLPETKAL